MKDVCVYVLGGTHKEELMELLDGYEISCTEEELLQYKYKGRPFTNYSPPYYFLSQGLLFKGEESSITFSLSVKKSTMKIEQWDLLDEDFGQPFFCNENEYTQIETIIHKLEKDGILSKCVDN